MKQTFLSLKKKEKTGKRSTSNILHPCQINSDKGNAQLLKGPAHTKNLQSDGVEYK